MERTTSACYDKRAPQWQKMRKLVEGGGVEKSLIITLPGMPKQTAEDYKERAYYLNATARTIEAFSGLPLSRPIKVESADGFEYLTKHITRGGLSIDGVGRKAIAEVLTTGRIGIWVDYPEAGKEMTVAQAEASHFHAVARLYPTEAILDFALATVGAKQFLSRVLLEETERVDGETVAQLRDVRLTEAGVVVTLYQGEGDQWVQVGETVTLMRGGKPLPFIPFRFINAADGRPVCVKPPTLDLGCVSVAHLNNSASLEWGLMWSAAPTPYFIGLKLDEGETVGLGSCEGIQLEDGGSCGFMEFSGSGLGAISNAMDRKQMDMAVLGARLLSDDKKGVEAAETTRIRKSGEQSALASICASVSEGLTEVVRWMIEWDGGDASDVSVRLNTDFLSGQIGFEELKSALELMQSGRMTRDTFHSLLVKAELVAPSVSSQDYQEELDDEAVTPITLVDAT